MYCVEDNDDGRGAFRACLDVGLARTSTGAKVFAALKIWLSTQKVEFAISRGTSMVAAPRKHLPTLSARPRVVNLSALDQPQFLETVTTLPSVPREVNRP